jgi:flagellar hook-associated protein 3 FlgL
MRAIGDLATFMLSKQFQARLRMSAETAAEEATTGLAKNRIKHLGGSSLAISLLDRKTQLLEQHQLGNAETAVFASATQSILQRVQDQSGALAKNLSLVSQLNSAPEVKALSDSAALAFVDIVNALNVDVAGQFLFSGAATNARPLPSGQALMDMLRADIGGPISADVAISAIESWFKAPNGPFETTAYSGSATGFAQRPIGPDQTVIFGLRADGETVRDLLSALATAALASDDTLGLTLTEQKKLLLEGHSDLLQADRALTEERAGLGLSEAMIDASRNATDIELDRVSMDRVSLLGVDQFEAASEFEAAQQQLEVFYRIAARQSRVSLAEYLR